MNFKDYFNLALVTELGQRVSSIDSSFDCEQFEKAVSSELLEMEMKDRLRNISTALYQSINKPYPEVVVLILGSLDDGSHGLGELRGFPVWVIANIIERYGVNEPDLSLQSIHKITQHFTGEFAIRPYLERYPQKSLAILHDWAGDSSADVRRLVSEGIRPRLPWAQRVDWIMQDPSEVFALLEKLYTDSSEYVRRSVANNLNDISKDHPQAVIERLQEWRDKNGPSKHLDWIIRHSCRSLIRDAYPGALQLQGYSTSPEISVERFQVNPDQIYLGNSFEVTLQLAIDSTTDVALLIDLILFSPGANGNMRRRVLKWCRREGQSGKRIAIAKAWPLKGTSTRQENPGSYKVELIINGKKFGEISFEVLTNQRT